MLNAFKKFFGSDSNRKSKYVSPYVVSFDDETIATTFKGNAHESVRWDDLIQVGIRIEQEEIPVPYWILFGREKGCMYPSDAIGNELILKALQQRLPEFDNQAVVQAMGLNSGGIMVWTRQELKNAS